MTVAWPESNEPAANSSLTASQAAFTATRIAGRAFSSQNSMLQAVFHRKYHLSLTQRKRY